MIRSGRTNEANILLQNVPFEAEQEASFAIRRGGICQWARRRKKGACARSCCLNPESHEP